jgi:hypothetical protein
MKAPKAIECITGQLRSPFPEIAELAAGLLGSLGVNGGGALAPLAEYLNATASWTAAQSMQAIHHALANWVVPLRRGFAAKAGHGDLNAAGVHAVVHIIAETGIGIRQLLTLTHEAVSRDVRLLSTMQDGTGKTIRLRKPARNALKRFLLQSAASSGLLFPDDNGSPMSVGRFTERVLAHSMRRCFDTPDPPFLEAALQHPFAARTWLRNALGKATEIRAAATSQAELETVCAEF